MIKPVLFAACDCDYFVEHAFSFVKSAADSNNFSHIVVWNNNVQQSRGPQFKDLLSVMNKIYRHVDKDMVKIDLIPHSVMDNMMKPLKIHSYPAFYASIRFLILDKIIEQHLMESGSGEILVLDIDSIINKEIKLNTTAGVGLYLRENDIIAGTDYEKAGMKVAAGAVYVTPESIKFVNKIKENLEKNEMQWFCDQHAIYSAYKEFKDDLIVEEFNSDFLDWEFKEGSAIWSGKGKRKYENDIYLAKKAEFDELI